MTGELPPAAMIALSSVSKIESQDGADAPLFSDDEAKSAAPGAPATARRETIPTLTMSPDHVD